MTSRSLSANHDNQAPIETTNSKADIENNFAPLIKKKENERGILDYLKHIFRGPWARSKIGKTRDKALRPYYQSRRHSMH